MPPMCLSDSQLLEAGEGGRGQGASRNIWLEAVQRHFNLSCSEAVISSWEVREMAQHCLSLK